MGSLGKSSKTGLRRRRLVIGFAFADRSEGPQVLQVEVPISKCAVHKDKPKRCQLTADFGALSWVDFLLSEGAIKAENCVGATMSVCGKEKERVEATNDLEMKMMIFAETLLFTALRIIVTCNNSP
jgi:hypothetical protein